MGTGEPEDKGRVEGHKQLNEEGTQYGKEFEVQTVQNTLGPALRRGV